MVEILTLELTCLIMRQKHIKNISHVDTSSFALKSNLAGVKTEVDKLDIDKLVSVTVDLRIQYTSYNCLLKNANFSVKTTNN